MLLNRSLLAVLCAVSLFFVATSAQTFPIKKRKTTIVGVRAVVYDERLSALRIKPDIKSPIIQRLHRDREVGIIGKPVKVKGGPIFQPVMVSRNTRGWVIADALSLPQRGRDAARMMNLIDETKDDFNRARLARLCADQYRGNVVAAKALLKLGEATEHAAIRLSRDAKKRIGELDEELDKNLSQRDYMLNYVGLDRYNKIGATFDYDEASGNLIYDGGAYQEISKKYPRSPEAVTAHERLEKIRSVRTPVVQK